MLQRVALVMPSPPLLCRPTFTLPSCAQTPTFRKTLLHTRTTPLHLNPELHNIISTIPPHSPSHLGTTSSSLGSSGTCVLNVANFNTAGGAVVSRNIARQKTEEPGNGEGEGSRPAFMLLHCVAPYL